MNKIIICLVPIILASCAADGSFESYAERSERQRIEKINQLSDQARMKDARPNEYAYNEGNRHGCSSGANTGGDWTQKFIKDIDQYVKNEYYKTGWNDGFAKCKAISDDAARIIDHSIYR